MHILVVEDEVALCDTIVRSLKRLAYSVDYCYDGQKALDILSGIDSNQPPFLVRSHFIANSENGQLCDLSRNLFIVSLTNQFTFCCFFRLQHNPNRDYCICRSCL